MDTRRKYQADEADIDVDAIVRDVSTEKKSQPIFKASVSSSFMTPPEVAVVQKSGNVSYDGGDQALNKSGEVVQQEDVS